MEQFLLKPANNACSIQEQFLLSRNELKTMGTSTKKFVQRTNSINSDDRDRDEDVEESNDEMSPTSPQSNDEVEPVRARKWLQHVNGNSSFTILSEVVLATASDETSLQRREALFVHHPAAAGGAKRTLSAVDEVAESEADRGVISLDLSEPELEPEPEPEPESEPESRAIPQAQATTASLEIHFEDCDYGYEV